MKNGMKRYIRRVLAIFKEKNVIAVPTPVNTNELLKDKVALITGGNGGIGFAMAKAFINSGCKVIIAGRNQESLENCCKTLGPNAAWMILDVGNVTQMTEKISEAAASFSENRIDILVNSAGIVAQNDFFHMTEQEYDLIMDINAKGTFFMSQAMANYMVARKIKGHILNVTSSSALRPAWTPYQMSKWAVRGFTLGLADKLLPYGIIVNAIAPGPVATGMLGKNETDSIYMENQPSGRLAVPSEIANLAVFMVSDMGNLIVGDTFYITGGSGVISYKH